MADETMNQDSEKRFGKFHRRVFEANALNFAVWATIASTSRIASGGGSPGSSRYTTSAPISSWPSARSGNTISARISAARIRSRIAS